MDCFVINLCCVTNKGKEVINEIVCFYELGMVKIRTNIEFKQLLAAI
jgi:hypothetical protein